MVVCQPTSSHVQVFTESTHIVAVRTSGNVYAYEAVQELNIKPKFMKDLLTDQPFTRKDIIHIQDPMNLEASAYMSCVPTLVMHCPCALHATARIGHESGGICINMSCVLCLVMLCPCALHVTACAGHAVYLY